MAESRLAAVIAAALSELRLRPFQLALAGFVAGLSAGPRSPVLLAGLLLLCPLLAGRALWALALASTVLGGAAVADARLGALDRTDLGPRMGHASADRVTLLERPRPTPFGGRTAIVRLGRERVLIRTSERVRWPTARVGEELAVEGALAALGPRDGWLRPRNVHAVLRAERVIRTGRSRGGLAGAVDAVRGRAERALDRGLPPPQAALMRGMVLGQDEALQAGMRDDFQTAGLSHLVAASGQNVMLLCALVFGLCALVGVGLRIRLAAALGLIALYVPLAGAGPSIQRAGVMGAAGVAATLAGRPASRSYAVLLAAAATSTLNPRAIEDVGWQLSFAAVAGIMVLARPIVRALRRRGAPVALAEAAAMTVAATIGTAPLIALHFDRTSLVSLPANILAAPAVAPVMWLGMASAALGQVSATAAAPFTALAAYPLAFLTWLGETSARMPLATVAVPALVVAVVCAAAGAALVWPPVRRPAPVAALLAVLGVLALVHAPPRPPGPPAGLRVTFLDVGQGDATLIEHRRTAVLVDTGPPDGGIVRRLRGAGIRRLDLMVVTHAQADHLGAAAAVLGAMPVGLVLDGRDGVREPFGTRMAAAAARRRVTLVPPEAGQTLRVGGMELRVLSPVREAPELHAGADPNQRAIVTEVRVGAFRMLLAADAESEVLSTLDLGPVDVLKVAHHGSADPGLAAVLERVRPRVAAIQVGARNTFGHPVPATVQALRAAGAAVYRTDRHGSIRLEETGGRLTVSTDV